MASFNSAVIARVAAALYDVQLGNASMTWALNAVDSVTYGGSVGALAQAVYNADFSGKSHAEVAAVIVANAGITDDDAAVTYVAGLLDSAGVGGEGAAIVNIMNAFSAISSGPYAAAAAAFNAQIDAALTHAQTIGTVDVPVHPASTVVFNLSAETAAGADVMHITGNQDVRIDFTNPDNQITGLDVDGDGVIEFNGVERSITGMAAGFEIVDAYSRNPLDHTDAANNFLGDIYFDGASFSGGEGDGTGTDGNIFLGGLGNDIAFGGVGNDFLAGGGVAALAGGDRLYGGRNADYFFGEFSLLDNVDGGTSLYVDGGNSSDDEPAGKRQSAQDSDWFLLEASDDDEPVVVVLSEESGAVVDDDTNVTTRSGEEMDLDDVENFDASGNLYGFLDDMVDAAGNQLRIGGRATDLRYADGALQGAHNYGIGSSAQLDITGSEVGNTIVAGYDNDYVSGEDGDDLLFGGNLQQLFETVEGGATNVNLSNITLDGIDELYGDGGNDGIVFEADTGVVDGGAGTDTLWLTNYTLGTATAADVTTDNRLRLDLGGQDDVSGQDAAGEPGYAGYGGADSAGTADQTNYKSNSAGVGRVAVDNMENIDATGLSVGARGLDYISAGTNDADDLSFENRQNFSGYDGNLDLRGTGGANNLYAGGGDDVLEGRDGNDDLMGGAGNDDFYFSIDGDIGADGSAGDGVDKIRRKVDANGDGYWDTSSGAGVWGQDFGVDESSVTGESVLRIVIQKVGGNGAGEDLGDVVNSVERITTGVKVAGTFEKVTLESADISSADTYEELVDAINAALAGTAFADDLTATLQDDGVTIYISDAQGRELADAGSEVAGAGVLVNQKANTQTENEFEYGEPEEIVSLDRLIYKAYEDRSDNEGVDDDAVTGSTISLGQDAYAEDLVVSFAADGTRIAEDQEYKITFTNLTTEDTVTLNVNGVTYTLQVGVKLNGTQEDDEDGVGDTQTEIQTAFLERFAGFIDSFMDDDTAAGKVEVVGFDATSITIRQQAYNTEETVFMSTPTVSITNGSGGERPSATVANQSSHEVLLYQFDGRDNNLNATNVLFWGQEEVSRSILETASNLGDTIVGSEALVIDGGHGAGDDDLAGIAHNLATDDELDENFAVHGDDYLIGGNGDDTISGMTGDDRVRGSLGNDDLDGGKDWYAVKREGDDEYTVEYLNAYDAAVLDADGDVLDIVLIQQTENGVDMIDGDEFVPYFDDTLIYHQADFTAGVTRFTITLNDYLGTGDAIVFDNGGAGTVGVDADGNGVVEVDNVSTFTNFENIRTVSGIGRAVAGTNGGQGRDTLNVMALSDDAEVGVKYDLTGDATAGDVYLIEDTDDDLDTTGDRTLRQVIKVDGVENVIFGDGDDILDIDETEAAKDNDITGDLGHDEISYENDFDNEDNEGDDEPTVTINVGAAHGTASDAGVDTVVMTEGRVGSVVATDTLRGIEEITLGGNTAQGIREDDELNVEALAGGATVSYVTGRIYSDTDGDMDFTDGVLQLTVNNLFEIENVVADGKDNVVVADSSIMSQNGRSDGARGTDEEDLTIDTFLNYDLLDRRDADSPERLSVSELRAIANGTDPDTADVSDIPEGYNFAQFTFSLGENTDTVDYSNAGDDIVVVVDFNPEDDKQYVLVDGDGDLGFDSLDDDDDGDRVDVLNDVENIVASQGESVLDLTNSQEALAITFSRDITVVGGKDVHRVQLANLNTDVTLGKNYLEFRDNDADDDNNPATSDAADGADIFAVWNRVEGSDYDEKVELTDAETEFDHVLNLRGGDNEVNYNELTRSISLTLNVVDYDEADPAHTGLITGDVAFTDGSGNVIGGEDEISSYSAQNGIAAGSLRVEASQDAEDSVGFASGLEKLFILGEVINGSDQITVRIGSGDAANSIELTGFEVLLDSENDDVYYIDDLERVEENLILQDNIVDDTPDDFFPDTDTIKLGADSDAVGYGAQAADTLSLEFLNDLLGFDFDVMDVSEIEDDDLILIGDDDDQDNDATLNAADTNYTGVADTDEDGAPDYGSPDGDNLARDTNDVVVVGDLDLIDDVQLFDSIWLTDASIDSAGDEYELDLDAGELLDGDGDLLFTYDGAGLNFSLVTDGGVTVTITDDTGLGANVVGTDDDDTITGDAGDDTFTGGGGSDTMDGGIVPEVTEVVVVTLNGGAATLEAGDDLEIAGVVISDAGGDVTVVAGSDADQVGSAFIAWAAVPANLAVIEGNLGLNLGDLGSVTYDATSNNIIFNFTSQAGDVPGGTVTVDDTLMATGTLTGTVGEDGLDAAGQSVAYAAQADSSDTFVFLAGDSTEGGMDVIYNFTVQNGAEADVIDTSGIEPMHSDHAFSVANGGSAFANYAAVKAAAEASISGPDNFPYVGSDGTDTWVFFDDDHDGTFESTDTVIMLAGITAAGIDNDNFNW